VRLSSIKAEMAFLRHLLHKFLYPVKPRSEWRASGTWEWYVCSHHTWREKAGLTRQQLRVVEARAEKAGVVDTVVWMHRGTPTKHYHLYIPAAQSRLVRLARFALSTGGQKGQSIKDIEEDRNYPSEIKNTKSSDAIASREESMGNRSLRAMGKKTALEVKAEFEAKRKAGPQRPEKISPRALSAYWMKLIAMTEDKTLHKAHGMKQLGQLKHYAKITGEHALPAMEWAIKNWARMRHIAMEELGIPTSTTPTIGSLLEACETAVNHYVKDAQKVQVVMKPVESLQFELQTSSLKATKASKEEVVQALKDMKNED